MRKTFVPEQKVLLYNFKLHLFSGKLKSRWIGPLIIKIVFPHGAVEISDTKNENDFKVNGQRLKPFLKSASLNETALGLSTQCIGYFPLLHSISCIYTFLSYIGDNA